MKKRIIITALSVMLASSSIIPAYAALPANASTDVEAGNGFKDTEAFNYWAQETEVAKSTFYKFTDMVNHVYMHDTDGTLYSVDPAIMSDTLVGTAKFYKCVAGKLIAITEEEAVTLGYVEE